MARFTLEHELDPQEAQRALKEINRARKKLKLKPFTAKEWKRLLADRKRSEEEFKRIFQPRVPTCDLPRTRY